MSKIQAETPITLEQEIVAALAGADVNSSDLSALIERTEAAIPETDQAAETARNKALDPALSPDPKTARAAMEEAAFARDRLKTLLPRLQARHQEVQAQEYLTQWRSDYEKLKAKRDGLEEELRTIYPEFETKITDLFPRIAANDAELSRLHQARPGGVALHLLGAELVARDLERFKTTEPSIAQELKLPTFAPGQRLAWPPPKPSIAIQVATSMTYGSHPSANWWEESKERAQAMRADHERVIAYYDAMAQQREKSEADEAQKRGKGAAA